MRGRTGLFKRVVSLAVTMSVLLSIGVTVHASSFYKGEVKINTMYDPAQQGGGYEYYGPDFYFTFTPTYTGDFNFNIRKSHPSDPTGRVSVYTGMSGEGAGFYDEVACWDITQTDFTPDTCHTLTLQNDTTYYIRFYAQSGYPAFAFYMDDTSHSFCHVTFHSSDVPGGSDEEVAECDLSRGYSSYLPNVNFTSRENQRVAGWSLEAGGELLYRAGDLITIGADQEPFNLYAVWGDRLSFNINEGTGDAIPDTGILSGDVVTLPECSWTKNGAAFVGWSLNADGTGTRYYPGDIFNFTEPTTFYAQYEGQASYEPLYQLSADANKMYLDIYVPYFNNSSSTALYLDNEVQDPYRRGVVVDSKTYDVYSISCPARCMTVPHTVEIRYGDSVLFTGSISVRSYLRSIINSSSSSDKQKDAARAMLRYGAAAQIYFDGLTEGDPSIANYEIRGAEISSLANMTIWQEHDLDFILWTPQHQPQGTNTTEHIVMLIM